MTADHWCDTLACGSSEQISKEKELKEIRQEGKRGPWDQQAHTSSSGVDNLEWPSSAIQTSLRHYLPGFGQDGVFPIPQKRRPREPARSDAQPGRGPWAGRCPPVSPRLGDSTHLPSLPWPPGGRRGPQTAARGERGKSEPENGMECNTALLKMNRANLGSFFGKNTVTLGDKSAELASVKCHFPACHLGIIC